MSCAHRAYKDVKKEGAEISFLPFFLSLHGVASACDADQKPDFLRASCGCQENMSKFLHENDSFDAVRAV